jgi:hypothetical protein
MNGATDVVVKLPGSKVDDSETAGVVRKALAWDDVFIPDERIPFVAKEVLAAKGERRVKDRDVLRTHGGGRRPGSRMIGLSWLLLLGGCGAGCEPPRLVNLRVAEPDDGAALIGLVNELDERGILATLVVGPAIATDYCKHLRDFDATGHEIMVYGQSEDDGILADLSREEQYSTIGVAKFVIEACLGHAVLGFVAHRFSQTQDTWSVLDELGVKYNLSYVAGTSNAIEGHRFETWAHRVRNHEFWAVPLQSTLYNGYVRPLSDESLRSVSDAIWSFTLLRELNLAIEEGMPLSVQFHPSLSVRKEGRWEIFRTFLDSANELAAEFVTARRLVDEGWTAE